MCRMDKTPVCAKVTSSWVPGTMRPSTCEMPGDQLEPDQLRVVSVWSVWPGRESRGRGAGRSGYWQAIGSVIGLAVAGDWSAGAGRGPGPGRGRAAARDGGRGPARRTGRPAIITASSYRQAESRASHSPAGAAVDSPAALQTTVLCTPAWSLPAARSTQQRRPPAIVG